MLFAACKQSHEAGENSLTEETNYSSATTKSWSKQTSRPAKVGPERGWDGGSRRKLRQRKSLSPSLSLHRPLACSDDARRRPICRFGRRENANEPPIVNKVRRRPVSIRFSRKERVRTIVIANSLFVLASLAPVVR